MSVDFRSLLKENMRNSVTGERWFEDLDIGGVFYLSIQASTLHDSTPMQLLDDVSGYESFQVVIQTKPGVFICGKKGAWDHIAGFDWYQLFQEDTPIMREAANVPASVVQRIYDDMSAVVAAHPEMMIRKGVKVM